jgi:hypothetical protein
MIRKVLLVWHVTAKAMLSASLAQAMRLRAGMGIFLSDRKPVIVIYVFVTSDRKN